LLAETAFRYGNDLVSDLGIIAVSATLAAILFYRLKLPVIVGYILAGIFLGSSLFGDTLIRNPATVHALAELGIIFLLFNIGMEFDVRRLQRMMGAALLTVVLQTTCMIFIGLQFAPLLGWNTINCLFLGCLLAISSSMVTFRVLQDQDRLKHPHGQLAIATLIMEDVLAVMMLVVLTGVAVTGHFAWTAVWQVTFMIGVFVVGTYIMGKLVAPRLLKALHKIGNTELITIFAVGLVLGIAMLAEQFHFSIALGAFLAGAILSRSPLIEKIEQATLPLRNVFGAVFFVSIGMLIDPGLLRENWALILLLSGMVIFGKIVTCWAGLYLAGQPSRSSFRAAMVKSQIGEFSFIIAGLGQSLDVTDQSLMSLATGVAFCTMLATPFLSQPSEQIYHAIVARMPQPILMLGEFYQKFLDAVFKVLGGNALLRLVKRPVLQITAGLFLLSGIILTASFSAEHARAGQVNPWLQMSIWLE